jgi:hypothetical protein
MLLKGSTWSSQIHRDRKFNSVQDPRGGKSRELLFKLKNSVSV